MNILKNNRPFLVIIVIGLFLYSWTAFFDYSYLDDNALILENYPIISNFSNIGNFFIEDAFFSTSNFYYRPMLSLSFMIDSFVSGVLPWFYHISNFIYHIIATCLIYVLLNRISNKKELSLFLALIFLCHPAFVQTVAWIPGRNDSLLAIFILSAFISFISYLNNLKIKYFVLFLLFFLLALFTKEAAIAFPTLLFVYYLFISEKKLDNNTKSVIGLSIFSVIFVWLLFRSLAIAGTSINASTIINSVLENSPALVIGLGKLFLPFDLSIISVFKDANVIYGLIGIIILGLLLIKKIIKKEYFVFGILWFILFFAPSLINPVPGTHYYFFEHRLYLPFIGVLIIASQIELNINISKKVFNAFALLFLLLFSYLTVERLPDYKNRISFWSSAVSTSENAPLAHRNLGVMYYLEGRPDEALVHYKKALELNHQETMVHNNIGVIYMERRLYSEAGQEFNLELANNPGYGKALDNLNNLKFIENQLR